MSISDAIFKAMQKLRSRPRPTNLEPWKGSTFEGLRSFQADERGQIGELVAVEILKSAGCVADYEPGVTDQFGEKDYDLIADGIKIEVKFATRGSGRSNFQHENLKKQGDWHALILIDVAPSEVFVVMKGKHEIPWGDPHRRKDSIGYQYDYTVKRHRDEGNRVETAHEFYDLFQDMKRRLNSNTNDDGTTRAVGHTATQEDS